MARRATKPQVEAAQQAAEVAEMETKAEDIQTEEKVAEAAKEEPKKRPGRKKKAETEVTETVKPARAARRSKKETKNEADEAPVKEAEAAQAEAAGTEAEQEKDSEESVKGTGKKSTARKAGQQCNLYVQYAGRSLSQEDLMNIAKDVWKYDLKQKAGDLKSVDLYVKPEENKVYYVMNGEFTGSFDI